LKKLLILSLLLFCIKTSYATHIVGGMVTYKYLGLNKYELTFKVYRDCNGGQAAFDGDPSQGGFNSRPFFFVVFDNQNGARVDSGSLILKRKDTVKSVIVSPCLPNADKLTCVEQALYIDTITVPDGSKWYSIVHQRCCRNSGINNLQPLAGGGGGGSSYPGMTIYNIIPPASSSPNNSADFKQFPPLFLCANQTFTFDHSATDLDGDVLKYYLVNPLDGGSPNAPQPNAQQISNVRVNAAFQTPYSLTNIIGGTPNISIDENTGLLACRPDAAGRYVVSVMVKEFRNGICIDSAVRDFQFNIFVCDNPKSDLITIPGSYDPVSKMYDYKVNCKNKIIDFQNSSTNSSGAIWNFGDPSSGTRDTSTLANPSHEYTDTGVFIVTLVSYKMIVGGLCYDTLRIKVRIYPTYIADFLINTSPPKCPGDIVSFTDRSVATYGQTVKWKWDFGNGKTDTVKNPTQRFDISGIYSVKLTATSSKNCVADTIIGFKVNDLPNISATLPNACIGQPFKPICNITVPAPDAITSVRWTLPDRVDNNCATTYTPPNMNNFTVKLWGQTDKGCKDSQTFNVRVNSLPTITALNDTFICYDSKLQLDANGGVSYSWTPVAQLNNPNSKTPIASPIYPNSSRYTVKGTDALGCYNFDSVLVSFHVKAFIDAGKDTNICLKPGPFKRETVNLTGQGNFITFYWTPPAGLDNPNSKTPIAKPAATTDYVFNGIDPLGCIVKDTVRVIVLDPSLNLFKKNDTLKCSYDTIVLVPLDLGDITTYKWTYPDPNPTWMHPNDYLKQRPRVYNRDTYSYTLIIDNYCYSDTESIRVDIVPSPITNLPKEDSTCYGNIYQFNLNSANTYRWSTIDPSLSNRSISNPTCNPSASVWYYITATNSFGCTVAEGMEMIVNYPPNVTILNKPRYICLGDSVQMSVLSNLKTRVRWSPGTYLSDSFAKDVYYFPPKTEELTLKVLTAENCFTIEKLKIPIQLPIKPNVQTPVHFCKGGFTELYASGGYYYLWKPYYKINDTLIDKPQVYPDSTFRYTVKVANDCFFDTIGVDVIVDTLPVVTTTPDTSIYRGAEIELQAFSAVSKMEWYPQEIIPTNPFLSSIRVQPIKNTSYFVKVTDANNCVGYDTVKLDVYSKNVLLIPSAFSPNGDGINDVFKVAKHLNVKTLNYFEIFNRWGQKVFSSTNIEQGWDGTYDGERVPNGTYTWQIQITNFDNERITKAGNIDVIR
jgi:gliding motility-associated-like protein